MDKLLTISQAAEILQVTAETLRRWDKAGKLTAIRLPGGHRRYRQSEIEALLSC